MQKDIEDKNDIDNLVNAFYTKVVDDDTIGYIFKNVPHFSFVTHIPIMITFWETLLFGVISYKGNPMMKHIELNKTMPLKGAHFVRWLELWEETVNENFFGKNASLAISKAKSIGGLMEYKINNTKSLR